jgi:phosphate transport system ATP-binding protein
MLKIEIKNFSAYYGSEEVIKNLNLNIYKNEIFSIIGPARSGKSTLLRILNRLIELQKDFRFKGEILIDGEDIFKMNLYDLRRKTAIVFEMPVVFPTSIYENIIFGAKISGIRDKRKLNNIVEESLKNAYLFEEVRDRLKDSALNLSGGQQQRLCLARALALKPEILLLDEPCSGLDPISTGRIEEALRKLKENLTIILVTNNVKQAARVSDRCAFLLSGELIEVEETENLFTNPKDKRTQDYITGRFG